MELINIILKQKKGLSIPELLIGITITGFISLSIYSVFFAHQRIYFNQDALIGIETQNKLALDEITRYSREGLQFSSAINWNSPAIGFKLLPLDPNGNPYSPGFFDHAIFEFDSVNKNIKEYGAADEPTQTSRSLMKLTSPRIIARGVTAFSVTYPDVCPSPCSTMDRRKYLTSYQAILTITTEAKTVFGKTFTSTKTATINLKY